MMAQIFNAEAVKFSIERTIRLGAGASYIWTPVDSINIVDDYTVDFKLKYQAPLDLIASTGYAAFIYSPKSVGSDDKWFETGRECGTGPYKLKSYKWGDEFILEKFDGYWGRLAGKEHCHCRFQEGVGTCNTAPDGRKG